jgi:hypothetical protein
VRLLAHEDVGLPRAAERLELRDAVAGTEHEAVAEVTRLPLGIEGLERQPLRRLRDGLGREGVEAKLPRDRQNRAATGDGDRVTGPARRGRERQQRLEVPAPAGEREEDPHRQRSP